MSSDKHLNQYKVEAIDALFLSNINENIKISYIDVVVFAEVEQCVNGCVVMFGKMNKKFCDKLRAQLFLLLSAFY
jgi:hypothetical protein